MQKQIEIKNARVHNLQNLSVNIPKNKLVVMTGVSGSGKSSLAFDTLYAEGQRRYVESLSSYARQFLGLMQKPDVESITGLSPAISIDQKTSSSNPRSTVGTITEIYDYLRLLYARVGTKNCPKCGKTVESQTVDEIQEQVMTLLNKSKTGTKIQVTSPIIQNKKGEFADLFEELLSKGYLRISIDGKTHNLDSMENVKLKKNVKHNIDLVIDRLKSKDSMTKKEQAEFEKRLRDAIELATNESEGEVKIIIGEKPYFYSENNTCQTCKISFPKATPASFSFNSPQGACEKCSGLGKIKEIDENAIYNPKLTILEGGIFPWSNKTTTDSWTLRKLTTVAKAHGFKLNVPISSYKRDIFELIFYGKGAKSEYPVKYRNKKGQERIYNSGYEGIIPQMERRYYETDSDYVRKETEKYMIEKNCSLCDGKKLKAFALAVKINEKNIYEITELPISECLDFIDEVDFSGMKKEIASPILTEIKSRLKFLTDVGLSYLTLGRQANSLSGGESQRIRLASQIGTGLTGVLYVLDEPSIGLHARDVSRLLGTLENLRDLGNSVIVVEHDYETMEHADWIIDIGPGAGINGGKVVAEGTFDEVKQTNTLTAKYLNKSLSVGDTLPHTHEVQKSKTLKISNVSTHNLKNIDAEFPLGNLICITGVSGSGKSSLINNTLFPAIKNNLNFGPKRKSPMQTGPYGSVEGVENIDKVIEINQAPIGRTPRSNPATYTGLFTPIRELFSQTQEARARGYKPGRFSFNVKGGRCEKCRGDGQIKIEMQFLPDMYVTCEECEGKRYNNDALEIDYKNKNIADVLDMTVDEASDFFSNISKINRKIKLLQQVGLGYIKLGQSAPTLSGGESQRIKLAKELSKMNRGHTLYILDEPTTGLHFHDVDKLLFVLKRLVNKGHSVIVIEHNLDIIRHADWIIDLGPEGGEGGGEIIATGTVEDIKNNDSSWTGKFLSKY
ncbi:excinuclease ABC subunit UvrA [Candidatus Dojkabacteria bacterium]|nr:excinuclease ABC subunit UvrA [Candidatus Dojkabacteria bacterium]